MKNLIWALAILFVMVVPASAQVENEVRSLSDLMPAIARSHNMFACIEINADSARDSSTVITTCARIVKVTQWSTAGLHGGTHVMVDMDYPGARTTSKIVEIVSVPMLGDLNHSRPSWSAIISYEYRTEAGVTTKSLRSAPISRFIIY